MHILWRLCIMFMIFESFKPIQQSYNHLMQSLSKFEVWNNYVFFLDSHPHPSLLADYWAFQSHSMKDLCSGKAICRVLWKRTKLIVIFLIHNTHPKEKNNCKRMSWKRFKWTWIISWNKRRCYRRNN